MSRQGVFGGSNTATRTIQETMPSLHFQTFFVDTMIIFCEKCLKNSIRLQRLSRGIFCSNIIFLPTDRMMQKSFVFNNFSNFPKEKGEQ